MTGHLLNSPSMRNPDFMELVWENGEVRIRGLSSKITRTTSPFSSRYLSRSKDGVKDSTFDDPISGLSSAVLGSDKRRSDKQLVDCSNVFSVNKFSKSDGDKLITDQVPGSSLKQQQETSFTRSKEKDRVNFSMFLSSGATRAMSSQGLANVKPLPPTSGGCPSENEGNFMATKMKSPRKESNHDEQMVASSSLCSRGASNCPAYPLKRRYEDTDLSEGSKGTKGKRKIEVHSLSERKRRDKINKKMHALKELIPNCTKEDKASMLDEAIEYLKSLQLQVQMMSMGNGVYMPSMMFHSPSTMQHLGGYSPMVVGMGMGMQMGLGCGAPTLIGIPEATSTLNMLGLRSMSIPPFVSSVASFIPQLVQTPGAGVSESAVVTPAQVDLIQLINAGNQCVEQFPSEINQLK